MLKKKSKNIFKGDLDMRDGRSLSELLRYIVEQVSFDVKRDQHSALAP